MPTRIQTASTWPRLLAKLGVKGSHKPMLDETWVPVAIMADVSDEGPTAPEEATSFVQVNAQVGVSGSCQLANGTLSGVDLLIDDFIFTAASVQSSFRWTLTDAADGANIGGITNTQWNDSNRTDTPPGLPGARADAFGAEPELGFIVYPANIPIPIQTNIVVAPGFKLAVVLSGLFNQAFSVNFNYRVRTRP